MSKTKTKPAQPQPQVEIVQAPWGPVLTQAAFILTIALIIARALMSEILRDPFEVMPGSEPSPRGAGAATSLVLDMVCWLPAILVLVRRVIERDYVIRLRTSHVLFGLLAIWAAVSTFWASDKFAALVTSFHMITAALLIWSTAQLIRSWLRLRIVAGICFGLLLAYLAQGLYYRFVDAPETAQFWRENKDRILRERGWDPNSFHAKQFERKLLNREMLGFNQSPNSYAAVIVMLSMIAAGATIQRYREGNPSAYAIVMVLPLVLLILYFTGTKTAFGTLIIGACILAGIRWLLPWMIRTPRLAFGVGVAAVVLVALAVIGHGMYHGSLPGASMTFRWRYWVASQQLFRQHPLLGVGWSNFASHYLGVRLPIAAEEIRDPHNFIVRAFVELGAIGGILVLAWLGVTAWELTRPVAPPATAKSTAQSRRALGTISFTIALGIIVNLVASIDWSQNSAFLMLEVVRRILFFGLILAGVLIVALRSLRDQEVDDRPAPWVLYGTVAGLAVFFIHNMVDFVLAEPGALTLFAVIAGAALGIRTNWSIPVRHRALTIAGLSALGLVWVVSFLGFVLPVTDAEQQDAMGDEMLRSREPIRAAALYRNAYDRMPLNAEYAYHAARAMMYGNENPAKVRAMLDTAVATDPMQVSYRLLQANHEARGGDPAIAKREYERSLALDPNNIRARLEYAEALITFNERPAAAQQIRIALEKNDQLHADEPKRLLPDELEKLRTKLKELTPTTTPTTTP